MKTVKSKMQSWLKDEKGLGTIEIVIILAVLVGLAFLFHAFAKNLFTSITNGIKQNTKVDQLFSEAWNIWIM